MPAPSHSSPSPAGGRLLLDLPAVPPEGLEIAGELPATVFDLEPGGPQPLSPLRYRLHVAHDNDRLSVSGELSADFSFECVRCLEPFTDRITLDGYLLDEELEGKTQSVDLTDRVREDILLALPGHPRCEEASLEPRLCPASEFFPKVGEPPSEQQEETSTPADSRHVWGALDQLDLRAAPNPSDPSRRNR
jgi:uncharacterized metal-binding protein YceD (DUF177 family)